MDKTFVAASADDVRALIATLWLGPSPASDTIGDVRLAPHQVTAIGRIRIAFTEFGGALLCDVVGSGKTYIGAAVASAVKNALIIAPASLRQMWVEALRQTQTNARFITVESLSSRTPSFDAIDTIIVDEAHHFRNTSTIRHRRLADLISSSTVLLMTATPIHNSRRDLESLLSLFLGTRAAHLSDPELATLVVRRDKTQIGGSAPIPEVRATEWLTVGDDEDIADAIIALPPPVPPRDSGRADSLVVHGLVRQWASSEAALRSAVQRRLTRASALEASLEEGDYPSAIELRSWVNGEDSIQLGFAGLLAPPSSDLPGDLLAAVRLHAAALRRLLALLKSHRVLDAERAERLRLIRSRHHDAAIVAFSSYEATVRTLFEGLCGSGRVALLTSRGGRVAGGRVSRSEIIEQFSPTGRAPPTSDRIDFLLTTDLLSEGVNLQRAEVVVHLDLPWTPARIDQRVGRIARIGSPHPRVSVYGLAPPPSAENILSTSEVLGEKWQAATKALGRERDLGLGTTHQPVTPAPAESHEGLRTIISRWRRAGTGPLTNERKTIVAAVVALEPGFIAVIERNARLILIGCECSAISECRRATSRGSLTPPVAPSAPIDAGATERALAQVNDWITARDASESAGLGSSAFLRTRRRILEIDDGITYAYRIKSNQLRLKMLRRRRGKNIEQVS